MVDKHSNDSTGTPAPSPDATVAPRRSPSHRSTDMRDTVAEMAERAQLISQEAGSKVAAAMKDVISAGAGLAGFAIESARDLVQYMVRRGQMTPEEADKLIREAEAAHEKRSPAEKGRPTASKLAAERAAAAKVEAAARAAAQAAAAPAFRPAARPLVPPAGSNGTKRAPKVEAPASVKTAKPVSTKPSSKATAKTVTDTKSAKTAKPIKVAKAAAKSAKAAKPAKPAAAKKGKR